MLIFLIIHLLLHPVLEPENADRTRGNNSPGGGSFHDLSKREEGLGGGGGCGCHLGPSAQKKQDWLEGPSHLRRMPHFLQQDERTESPLRIAAQKPPPESLDCCLPEETTTCLEAKPAGELLPDLPIVGDYRPVGIVTSQIYAFKEILKLGPVSVGPDAEPIARASHGQSISKEPSLSQLQLLRQMAHRAPEAHCRPREFTPLRLHYLRQVLQVELGSRTPLLLRPRWTPEPLQDEQTEQQHWWW